MAGIFLLTVLSFFIGVPMGVLYPFETGLKVLYIISVLISVAMIVYGARKFRYFYGKTLLGVGIILWTFLGFLGLGTGT